MRLTDRQGNVQEMKDQTQCFNKSSTKFGMEISAKKTKHMINNLEALQQNTK